ncbi:hypothetical protein SAMN05660350_04222 [Geodermatophilus obscurus]|uniref:Uncharacterized protein n=1 Tax=Geodermatophilus obscurus TaxID=1861 RepID=A0A1M7UXR8_9ACTN|nr:hypothetical protein SAMN05660350_04222 [Geodermatophilus obscurus]
MHRNVDAARTDDYPARAERTCHHSPANATTDDSGPRPQSIRWSTREERTVMTGTKQTPLWVTGGVRQGGLPAMTDES